MRTDVEERERLCPVAGGRQKPVPVQGLVSQGTRWKQGKKVEHLWHCLSILHPAHRISLDFHVHLLWAVGTLTALNVITPRAVSASL